MATPRWVARAQAWAPLQLARQTVQDYFYDGGPRLGAALAYYSMFAIAPLFVLALALAGLVFGREAAQGELFETVSSLVGPQGAQAIETMVANAWQPRAGLLAAGLGALALLFGASGVFGQLKAALNTVWDVHVKPGRGWKAVVKERFASVAMVLGVGFLLLVSLLLSAALGAAGKWTSANLPGGAVFWAVVNFAVSVAVVTLLFALMFKLIPDAEVRWRNVWVGAFVTSLLFTVGKAALGMYLGRSAAADVYGAAGSLVLVLIWVYYSAQLVLLGAEFTQVYTRWRGDRIVPDEDAVAVPDAGKPGAGRAAARKNQT